jgi:hypothetical protein
LSTKTLALARTTIISIPTEEVNIDLDKCENEEIPEIRIQQQESQRRAIQTPDMQSEIQHLVASQLQAVQDLETKVMTEGQGISRMGRRT